MPYGGVNGRHWHVLYDRPVLVAHVSTVAETAGPERCAAEAVERTDCPRSVVQSQRRQIQPVRRLPHLRHDRTLRLCDSSECTVSAAPLTRQRCVPRG